MQPTVLIVDDDPIILLTLGEALKINFNVNVITAETPMKAFEIMATTGINLVVLDMNLPGMDGKTMLERIRKYADKERLPVVVCTGMSDRSLLGELVVLGINDYIVKPFRMDMIIQKFQNFFPVNK